MVVVPPGPLLPHIAIRRSMQILAAPTRPTPGEIRDWASWYKWRGLSLESPAALLMDGPLSVYHLLVSVLKVVDVKENSGARQRLKVHLLGVEVELNFLLLLSELALLLPQTDVEITLFGKPAYDLVVQAREEYPQSLATRDPVWFYTVPEETGGGSVSVKLYSKAEFWKKEVVSGGVNVPDAMVALNAGLFAYTRWVDPIIFSAAFDIPFAVTEYAEQSLETAVEDLPQMWRSPGAYYQILAGGQAAWHKLPLLGKRRKHPIAPNPFHRPGQRSIPVVRMPNLYNWFTAPVVLSERAEKELGENRPALPTYTIVVRA